MYETLLKAKESISYIMNLVENDLVDEKYELITFREEPGIIDDLLSDLNEAITVALKG